MHSLQIDSNSRSSINEEEGNTSSSTSNVNTIHVPVLVGIKALTNLENHLRWNHPSPPPPLIWPSSFIQKRLSPTKQRQAPKQLPHKEQRWDSPTFGSRFNPP